MGDLPYENNAMKITFTILSFFVLLTCSPDKSVDSSEFKKVDDFLSQFQGNRPGYGLGIVEKGKLTYSKGYGLANLEYNIPITDSSAFYIGSMAKQFTTAALLVLESKNKIDFNNPVQYYLPNFPTYNHEITINHLIHHTSGIRETNSLQLFQGIDRNFEEVFTTNDLVNLILRQNHLNFPPGEEYRYSSGGYAILAKIVEKVSGQTFRDFLHKTIFKPLQMTSTVVSDNHNEIVPNRVVSYWPIDKNKYERRSQVFNAYGDGGIITTVKDLAKWDRAFYTEALGVSNFAEKMYQKSNLNNQEINNYARALNVWEFKGQKVIQHNGGMLGFRVDMVRFPELETTIILLGNSAFLDPTGDALKIAEILLEESFEGEESIDKKIEAAATIIPHQILSDYTGSYWTDQLNYFNRITLQNDSLFIDGGNPDYKQFLIPITSKEFVLQNSHPKTHLHFNNKDSDLSIYYGKTQRNFRRFNPTPPQSLKDIEPYLGIYKSSELESKYEIFQHKQAVFLKVNKKEPRQIFPLDFNSEMVWNGTKMLWIGYAEIKFDMNDDETVNGFTIGDGRVSGVRFIKETTSK